MHYALAVAGLVAAVQATTYTLTETAEVTVTSCAPTHTNCPYKSSHDGWEEWQTSSSSSKPVDPTAASSWGSWDPSSSKTPVASSTSTASWGSWDPSSSKTPVASSTASWGSWDPSSSKTPVASSTASWGSWDPSSSKTPVASSVSTGSWSAWESTGVSTPVASTTGSACPKYTGTAAPAWFSQLPSEVLSSFAASWTAGPPSDWCSYSFSSASATPTSVITKTKTPEAASGTAQASTWAPWATGTGAPVAGVSATKSGPIAAFTGAASNVKAGSLILAGAVAVAAVVIA